MMDTAMLDSHLQKLEELVYDEDKIVTCVTLAELLKISIQDAKQLVSKFVEDQRQSKPQELSVTYLLSGILKGAQFPSVHLVKEHDLKRKKAAFDKVICEILYSVQKSNDIDFNIIAQVEKVHPDNPRQSPLIGSVVSKNCVKRKLRPRKIPEPPPPKQIVKKKPSFFTNVETKNEKEAENKTKADTKNEKVTENNKAAPAKENQKSKQDAKGKGKGGLANFLTKGAQKSVCVVKPTVKSSEDKSEQLSDVNEKDEKSTEKEENVKPHVAKEKMEVDEDDDTRKKESTASKMKEPSTAGKKNKKKRPNKENNEQPNKKRRRIVQEDDSDSDDMFGDNEDNYDDVIERAPDEEPEPPPVQKVPLAPKNKIRKAVDKTYEDEDGFIVTRTEYVLESASEDEKEEAKAPEKPPQKPSVSEEKKKLNSSKSESDISPKNNKTTRGKKGKKAPAVNQPTLMNFFKKK